LGALRNKPAPPPPSAPAAQAPPPPRSAPAPAPPPQQAAPAPSGAASASGALPTRDELTKAWGDTVLAALPRRAQARFAAGRFTGVEAGAAVFALPNAMHRDRCEEVRGEVEAALGAHFHRPVAVRLVVDAADTVAPEPPPGALDDDVAVEDLGDGPEVAVASPEERLLQAFPGATEVEPT
jgi:hypothetical protein